MRLLIMLVTCLFMSLFLVVGVLALMDGRWRQGAGALGMAALFVPVLLERWPQKPLPPSTPSASAERPGRQEPRR